MKRTTLAVHTHDAHKRNKRALLPESVAFLRVNMQSCSLKVEEENYIDGRLLGWSLRVKPSLWVQG